MLFSMPLLASESQYYYFLSLARFSLNESSPILYPKLFRVCAKPSAARQTSLFPWTGMMKLATLPEP